MTGAKEGSDPWADEGLADVLVVDDNPRNLLAVEAALGTLGCRLVSARSGAEAIRQLLSRDFAVILLDVQMPNMDGFETARFIRQEQRSRHVPIIFITAFSLDETEVLRAYQLGAVDFLFKPIVPAVLRAKVSVFVELGRRTAEVMHQARLLRDHERREHERILRDERARWEAAALRIQMDEQRRVAEESARRADELARTVAEKEHAERELVRMNRELELADKRKDEFLAVLAHELRNPLSPIVTGLELINESDLVNPVHVSARRAIKRQVDHLTRLVDDLLDISRITSGRIELRREVVELRSVIEHAVATSRPEVEKGEHELVVTVPDGPVHLNADPVRLTQVVSNLLNNAARYTPPKGRIEVHAEVDGAEVVIHVRDNGRGIAPEMLGRVFDMFTQTEPGATVGLGLGLTLVEQLIQLHQGVVTAESPGLGKGSTFTIRLPAHADVGAAEPRELPSSSPPSRETVATEPASSVVVIEDNDDVRDLLCALLKRWGFEVAAADNGEAGIELVKQVRPGVALVDIGMPGLDGYAVASRLRSEDVGTGLRLVAMTGYGQERDRQRAFAAGFDTHLVKPVDPVVLRRVLQGDTESRRQV